MKIYNTLTRRVEEFVPNEEGKVKMYTCGPTVYNFAHIGNLRTYLMEDVLEKSLRYAGYDVMRVMNITDIGHLSSDADSGEDKMLLGAKREHKTVLELAKYYTDAFFADCAALNIKKPDVVQPATGCVEDFIRVISALMEKGYAYFAGGNVYFDTSRLKEYHVFFNFKEEDLEVGVREGVGEDANKRNKNDFVLWFTKSKFEDQALKWDSPWGVGYPGWHIECSCIAMKYLGERVDIHCGGIDNVFPHHTNEIAQSEAYLGHKWCNYWFHVLHLNTQSGKMSKSSGGFLTLNRLKELGFSPMEYRFFCLQSHYRKSLVFSEENLENAAVAYRKLKAKVLALSDEGEADAEAAARYRKNFADALGNDLNTSLAVTAVYDVLKAKDLSGSAKRALIGEFDRVLSLDLLKREEKEETPATSELSAQEIEAYIASRALAKKEKNYAEADRIRDLLAQKGVSLVDTPSGTTYKIER
ncbi:MAG TPA: cysteine--tRNA ligase [Candidatus Borkfalkia excrementavium]|uniref:Cysteine--tRNA ligase n=1 Tax=Candidatus Borkfalkia excrementavium TaxID=2838505 RepID=A0A9D1Z8F2_9FIRM|nr:cysteine--tRNA ligase [Candidatus Borkfalkia excrementavium]